MWDFELVSMEKTRPPLGDEKGNWYQYTIANQITMVSGCRRGSKAEVSKFVELTLKRLNARHLGVAARQAVALP